MATALKTPKVVAPKAKKVTFPKQPGVKAASTKVAALKPMKATAPKMSLITNPKTTTVIHQSVGAHYQGAVAAN